MDMDQIHASDQLHAIGSNASQANPMINPNEMSEEQRALENEVINLKIALEDARKAVADTDFYKMTERVMELGIIKFKVRKHLRGHLAKVTAIQWGSDNQLLLSAAQDGKLIVWDTFTGKKIHMILLKTAWVMGCAMSPSLNLCTSGGLDNVISLFSLQSRENSAKFVRELNGHTGYVSCLRFIDEHHLLSSSGDKTCKYWDIENAKVISTYRGHANDVTALALPKQQSSDTFVTSSSDRTCRVWDIRLDGAVQCFEGHEQDVNGVDFFPLDAYAFASSSDDRTCRLWDLRADQAIGAYYDDRTECGCTSVAISKSGRLIIAGYDDFDCRVWDLLREERVGVLLAHENRISCVAISESGVGVATGSWDTTCLIWTAK